MIRETVPAVHAAHIESRLAEAACVLGGGATAPVAANALMRLVLDHLDYGIVLIDAQARTLHANSAAGRLLQRGDLLQVRDGMLEVAGLPDDAAWRGALVGARRGRRALLRLGAAPGSVGVAVVPLLDPETGEHLVTLVVVGRPSICESLSTQWYARRHDLTQAESGVLELLCGGLKPAQIAQRLGVAVSTVRTHICSIRSKTGVASVGTLLHEIATLPPMAQALHGALGGAWLQ
jgi:DNA-binding CsgD family transcriptional regulator